MAASVLNLPDGYSYMGVEAFERKTPDDRCMRIREVTDAESARRWVDQLMETSYVSWKISKTMPEGRTNIFKQYLSCQHATDKRVTGKRSSKKFNCPATLTITVQRLRKKTRSKIEGRFVAGWPTLVLFTSAHNHLLLSAAILKYRHMCADSRRRLVRLFLQGHTPSSALRCLKAEYVAERSAVEDSHSVADDRQYVPSLSVVHKLYAKEFRRNHGALSGQEMFADLEALLERYNVEGVGRARFVRVRTSEGSEGGGGEGVSEEGDMHYVVVCTPIMARAHELLSISGDSVTLDVAGGFDSQPHRVYTLLAPTPAGAVPLGVIITRGGDREGVEVFESALDALKQCLPESSFFNKRAPAVFLTDGDMNVRAALQEAFPTSRVLIGQFEALRGVWAWLVDPQHGVAPDHAQALYTAFRAILYSSGAELEGAYQALVTSPLYHACRAFAAHFQTLWLTRMDWAHAFRPALTPRGAENTPADHLEAGYRIVKDCVFNRPGAGGVGGCGMNVTQLVEFVITRHEAYVRKRLANFANGRHVRALLRKLMSAGADVPDGCVVARDEAGGVYDVRTNTADTPHTVDLIKGCCSCGCEVARAERLCRHAAAALLKLDAQCGTGFHLVSVDVRAALFRVATGTDVLPGWHEGVEAAAAASLVLHTNGLNGGFTGGVGEGAYNGGYDQVGELLGQLEALRARVKHGLQTQPDVYGPAVRAMLHNTLQHAGTDHALMAAMQAFGLKALRGDIALDVGTQARRVSYAPMSDVLVSYIPMSDVLSYPNIPLQQM